MVRTCPESSTHSIYPTFAESHAIVDLINYLIREKREL
jgi:hypothetical protein